MTEFLFDHDRLDEHEHRDAEHEHEEVPEIG